jgi:hypothetical protein
MSIHDSKLRHAINLTIDKHWAANKGVLDLTEVRNEIRVIRPARDWHPMDRHTMENAWLGDAIKTVIKEPMSQQFAEAHGIYVPRRYRLVFNRQPRGFYVRSINKWVDSLYASPRQWDEGEDARVELGRAVIIASDLFRENAKLLRQEEARYWMDLLKRES